MQTAPRSRRFFGAGSLPVTSLLAIGGALLLAEPARSQGTPGSAPAYATRSQLESLATVAESEATGSRAKPRDRDRRRVEATHLRERLREGDLRVGDRIVLEVQGERSLSDTFTVRAGRVLLLPNISPISVEGVLRSELPEYLAKELRRYLREPVVRATTLIRIQLTGQVTRPGFYAVPSDVLVSNAIMIGGGPTGNADLQKVTIRRGESVIADEDATQAAIRDGRTLDQLDLRAGDEIAIGERQRRNFTAVLQVLTAVAGIAVAAVALSKH